MLTLFIVFYDAASLTAVNLHNATVFPNASSMVVTAPSGPHAPLLRVRHDRWFYTLSIWFRQRFTCKRPNSRARHPKQSNFSLPSTLVQYLTLLPLKTARSLICALALLKHAHNESLIRNSPHLATYTLMPTLAEMQVCHMNIVGVEKTAWCAYNKTVKGTANGSIATVKNLFW